MPDVPPPVGDGQFKNISWRFPWKTVGIPIVGYSITFASLDLSRAHDVSYNVEHLPEIGKSAVVYFCIVDDSRTLQSDEARRQLKATCDIDIVDGKGQSVCHVVRSLAQMYWADPEGGRNTYGLYTMDSVFEYGGDEEYRIRVRYSSDAKLQGFQGFVYIRCGGHI
jgi:hypothetical protein